MPASRRPADPAQATGTQTTADDIRREFYEEAPWSQWIVELQLDPLVLIVSDDSTGALYRVPVLIDPAQPGEVEFGPQETVLVSYLTAPSQTAEAAKGGPRRRIAAAWAGRQTSRAVTGTPARRRDSAAGKPSEIITAAVARGALTADRARHYLEAAANGQDVTWVARLWGPGKPARAGQPQADPDEAEATYRALYPLPAQAAAALGQRDGREPDRLGQADVRHAWLTSQAAAGDGTPAGVAPPPWGGDLGAGDLAPEPGGHEPTTAQHDHEHSDYAGGQHSHLHEHAGDASHEPGAFGHQHNPGPPADPVAAGIAARAAAGDAGGGEIVDHGRTTVAEHEHAHSDYQGGVHSHKHAHTGPDANHQPGNANHMHQLAPSGAVAAGIAAARRERLRADPASAGDSDSDLFDRLFGKPPGR